MTVISCCWIRSPPHHQNIRVMQGWPRRRLCKHKLSSISTRILIDLLRKSNVGQAFSLTLSEIVRFGGLQTRPTNTYARGLKKKTAVTCSGFCWSLSGVCFTGSHAKIQVVLFWGEDASGKICKGAGRAVGFVEVNEYTAMVVRVRVMITT